MPVSIKCGEGCSDCCRGLFDITLLDAWYLKTGFDRLDEFAKRKALEKAGNRLKMLLGKWPEFERPYILNIRPETDWEELMPDEDETPCPLLSEDGRCLVYEYRPMTCRLHGLPLVDVSGEVFHDEWCTKNFTGDNPLEENGLYWNFSTCFQTEITLFRQFTYKLFNRYINEIDTLIPTALLVDYGKFNWKEWLDRFSDKLR
ncbi:MAG TPA: YkgJ family cysteine cluster protein [Geobacteraceae bacterium]|nr:YkgJ family cysteine cluster protein [Geobacteraceae bacterium]